MKPNPALNSSNTHLHKPKETNLAHNIVFWPKQAISYMYPTNPIGALDQTGDFMFHLPLKKWGSVKSLQVLGYNT